MKSIITGLALLGAFTFPAAAATHHAHAKAAHPHAAHSSHASGDAGDAAVDKLNADQLAKAKAGQ